MIENTAFLQSKGDLAKDLLLTVLGKCLVLLCNAK